MNVTQQMPAFKDEITDAEIERAINEIQNAIKKVSK
jgi:mono/diheme cytochrome c family protein